MTGKLELQLTVIFISSYYLITTHYYLNSMILYGMSKAQSDIDSIFFF